MRRSISAVVAAGVALFAVMASPMPASAAPDTIEIATTPPASYHYWHFGDLDGSLRVGNNVRTFVADLGLPIDETVRCWASTSTFEYYEQTKSETEWLASPAIPLPDDFTIAPGDTLNVTCVTGEEEYYAGFYIRWTLLAVAGDDEIVALPTDPDTAWSRHSYNYVSPENPTVVPAQPGDSVRVVGPAGTFLPDQPLSGAFGPGNPSTGDFSYLYFSEDAAVSADGSTLTFTLPTDVLPMFDAEPLYARFATGPTTDEFPDGERSERTVWWGGFDLRPSDAPQVASSARAALSLNNALSIQRVKAIAVISVPEYYSSEGTVTFRVDGKPVGTAVVTAESNNRASLLLPKLPRGKHVVTVEFGGSERVAPSVSRAAVLRILL